MLKGLLASALAAILATGMGLAGQSSLKPPAPDSHTPPRTGPELYARYCTSCHGADGRGVDPVPARLTTPAAADLTALSKKNNGNFPKEHVVKVLLYGTEIPAHTANGMPVWGSTFARINRSDPWDKMYRVEVLTRYLQTIQAK